jgi:hypothetical protein
MDKMREVFESSFSSRNRANSEELALVLADEIIGAKDLTDIEQSDVIR